MAKQTATVVGADGEKLLNLAYGHAATIWRINRGWKRRKDQAQLGFVLDLERGYWGKDTQAADADENDGDLVRKVWARVRAGTTAAEAEQAVEVDSFRVRTLLAHWIDEGAAKIENAA